MSLRGELVPVTEISQQRRAEMYALMELYYENMQTTAFANDLEEKNWVIQLLEESSGRLVGFSTQQLIDMEVGGRPIKALFSGDTIIDAGWRGQQRLFQVSGWLIRRLMAAYPRDELYWFLISKGYKTYRFLPLFFKEFYPCYAWAMPVRISAVRDALGACKSATRYDQQTGILRAGRGACRLKPGMADITPERLKDPHVQYFVQRNPGHVQGDELCCVAPLTAVNFTRAAYRAMGPTSPIEMSLI